MRKKETQKLLSAVRVLKIGSFALIVFSLSLSACNKQQSTNKPVQPQPTASSPQTTPVPQAQSQPQTIPLDQQVTMDVAKAVMVTVELDYGKERVPTIAEALKQIERQYKPDDGQGRTFSILDAYGEPTPDGKKLHMSMHVSSEKPGLAKLVFKKTGEVLWNAKINPSTMPPPQKALRVIMETAPGNGFNVDVSKADTVSILDSPVSGQPGKLVKDLWPDGTEREITFVYSACGCPVKAMVKRVGDRTARTKDLPVMFPDDPEAYRVIAKLMRWS